MWECICGKCLGTNRYCSYCREFREMMHIKEKTYDRESKRPYRGQEELE